MRVRRGVLGATLLSAAALTIWACNGSSNSLSAGEVCHSSSECASGLVCDFNQVPAVCASNLTPLPDAAPPPDADLTPDAPPGTPDAAPQPDAPPAAPDASPPDASPPDASLPDALLPDAM